MESSKRRIKEPRERLQSQAGDGPLFRTVPVAGIVLPGLSFFPSF